MSHGVFLFSLTFLAYRMATCYAPTMAYSSKADDISFLINDVPELTEDEKITLMTAMKKAQVRSHISFISEVLDVFKRL